MDMGDEVFTILKIEFLQQVRKPWMWILYTLMIIYLAYGYKVFVAADLNLGQMLKSSSYIVMSCILTGLFYGIRSATSEVREHMEEVLSVTSRDIWLRSLGKLVSLVLMVMIHCVVSFATIMTMVYAEKSETR